MTQNSFSVMFIVQLILKGSHFYFFLFLFPSTSSALVRVEKILIEVGAKCVAGIILLMLRMIIRKESRMCRLRGVGAPPFPPVSMKLLES